MKYVIGFILIGVGFLIVWKSKWFFENFGAIAFAERKFGTSGGSEFFYKLIGLAVIFLAFLIMSGGIVPILQAIFKPKGNF